MKRLILNTSPFPALTTHKEAFFGAYAHQKLIEEGKSIGRSLEAREECESKLPIMEICRFFNVSDCVDPKLYYVPWFSNHPCINSVILNKGYFQMTLTLKHDITKNSMKEIGDELKMDKFYFIIPHTIYGDFRSRD
jgi:hypothetical protein